MALELGIPVQRLKQETSNSEVKLWSEKLKRVHKQRSDKEYATSATHWYLGAILRELFITRRCLAVGSHDAKSAIKQSTADEKRFPGASEFLLKFSGSDDIREENSEEEIRKSLRKLFRTEQHSKANVATIVFQGNIVD